MSADEYQPVELIQDMGDLYFRSIILPHKGDRVPQHVHDHDHATLIGSGSAYAFVNGEILGYFVAPYAVEVKAGQRHEFEAAEDNTRLICVHSIHSAESIKAKEREPV